MEKQEEVLNGKGVDVLLENGVKVDREKPENNIKMILYDSFIQSIKDIRQVGINAGYTNIADDVVKEMNNGAELYKQSTKGDPSICAMVGMTLTVFITHPSLMKGLIKHTQKFLEANLHRPNVKF